MSSKNEIDIYIRPLAVDDAEVSYRWRNNPIVWQLTGSRPDRQVTFAIEQAWIKEVLARKNEKRFAICIAETDEYIGNVQLTNLEKRKAEFHIFIGETKYWGKGVGRQATQSILEFAFTELQLNEVYLLVLKAHKSALMLYQNCGFVIRDEQSDQYLMVCNKD